MPDAITSTPPTTPAMQAVGAPSSTTSNKADSDMFLKLLVAQMRYQNPLEPMKGTEFIAQSAQLATVESLQAIQSAQTSAAAWGQTQAAHSMMGMFVDASDVTGAEVTGQVVGVKSGLGGATLTLLDQKGNTFDVSMSSITETRLPISTAQPTTAPAAPAAVPATPSSQDPASTETQDRSADAQTSAPAPV